MGEAKSFGFEIEFFEGVVGRKPNYIPALKILGDLYTRSGEYQKGLEVDLQLADLAPDDAEVFYNLACSYALLGEKEKAIEILQKALLLGYRDYIYMQKDPDLANLHSDARFKEILRLCKSRCSTGTRPGEMEK